MVEKLETNKAVKVVTRHLTITGEPYRPGEMGHGEISFENNNLWKKGGSRADRIQRIIDPQVRINLGSGPI